MQQTALTIPLTDLPPAAQAALAAGHRIDITSSAVRMAVLVPIEPATLSRAEALAAIAALLDRVDATGQGEAVRAVLSQGAEARSRP